MRMDINRFWRVMLGSYSDNPVKYVDYYQEYCRYHEPETTAEWVVAEEERETTTC